MKLSSLFSKGKNHGTKTPRNFTEINNNDVADDFDSMEKKACTDPYLQHAWVSVCIDILTRNIARANFEIRKDGKTVTDSKAARLFQLPNSYTSKYDLWKQTCAWWSLDGEAF